MGGTQFDDIMIGKNVKDAFNKAVEKANYDYGHGGYTGQINVKDGYVEFPREKCDWPTDIIQKILRGSIHFQFELEPELKKLFNEYREYYDDKWGPAVAIKLTEFEEKKYRQKKEISEEGNIWFFCGWAST